MNHGPLLFLGAFLSMVVSFWGLIVVPQAQLGRQDLRVLEPSSQTYPHGPLGQAKAGADVYRAHGCVECHTQQVRPEGFGSDIERGWGIRRTVSLDYLLQDPVQLGSLRMGPDLANIGARQPDPSWHFNHLYNPKSTIEASTMPPYKFLFEERPIDGAISPDALQWNGALVTPKGKEEGWQVVPTAEGKSLVAYLTSLRSDAPVFEAPLPPEPEETNAPPAEPINPEDFQ